VLYYFDSSILLSILLDENRKADALALWGKAPVRVSSLLLKLEAITVLRRTYEHNKGNLEPSWLTKKSQELDEYLQEVNFRIIDEDIEKVIFLKKEFGKCRTLDAIHIATALEMSKIVGPSDFFLFTFDKDMSDLAKALKLQTNDLSEANRI
jgi:predicted nucleic acid-binding protein